MKQYKTKKIKISYKQLCIRNLETKNKELTNLKKKVISVLWKVVNMKKQFIM